MANYEFQRPEYVEAQASWTLVKDCVKGSKAIKAKGVTYLPMPNPYDQSDINKKRYYALLNRAMFLNVTARTKVGLIGAIFRKTAEVDLPSEIEYLKDNANGSGQPLEQLSKRAVGEVLETARGGLFTDYAAIDTSNIANTVKAKTDLQQAHIHLYLADNIINWREDVVNGISRLVLVVLAEIYTDIADDGFTFTTKYQYRALTLENGVYRHRLFRDGITTLDAEPRDYNGNTFDHIPFHFIGAEDNDATIDKAPLEDLAEVNILHYGNSATVEESGFISSQPTLFYTTNIAQDEFEKWNPNGIQVGSTRGYSLGSEGKAELVQASESQLALKLMEQKEKQMLMIGARIVQATGQAETAEAVRIRYSSDNSILGTVAGNVSDAMKSAMHDVLLYMKGSSESDAVKYWLNQEFFPETMTSQDILAQIQLWQQGIIAKSDLRTSLRQADILDADRNDDMIDDENQNEAPILGNALGGQGGLNGSGE